MGILILGLIIFLGVHSVRLLAPHWRNAQMAKFGERPWKGAYAFVSVVGFVLIVVGYGIARRSPSVLWTPPLGIRHLSGLLVLVAFILITAAYVPRNRIKRFVGHPMYAGVAIWAIGHLLANGTAPAVILFGPFFVWASAGFVVSRERDRAAGVQYPPGTVLADVVTIVGGIVAWAVFAFVLHSLLIGVRPL